jgi:general secretion pathway protein I
MIRVAAEFRGLPRALMSRGFTLIEVMVALVVLAVALAAVIRLLGQSADGAMALRDRTLARWVAEDRLTRHALMRDWPAIDNIEGEAEMGGRTFKWREQVSATQVERLRRIDVTVLDEKGASLVLMTGFASRPTGAL